MKDKKGIVWQIWLLNCAISNGSYQKAIELRVVEFWSVISNRPRVERSFDFEIMCMISDQIALHSVQLPL